MLGRLTHPVWRAPRVSPPLRGLFSNVSPYQMPRRNATFCPKNCSLFHGRRPPLVAATVALLSILLATTATAAAPTAQSVNAPPHLFLLPASATNVSLKAHVADFVFAGDSGTLLSLAATYELKNPNDSGVVLGLRLTPIGAGDGATPVGFGGLALRANGQPLGLQPTGDGGYLTEVALGADAEVTVALAYTLDLTAANPDLPTLAYAVGALTGWPGTPSLRVGAALPGGLSGTPADSWLRISPPGWSYAGPADAITNPLVASAASGLIPDIKWLYDAGPPGEPLVLQFIAPARWREIEAAQQRDPTPQSLLVLGNFYGDLYFELNAKSSSTAQQLYTRALAAYTSGLAAADVDGPDSAALHAGLARLYRSRLGDGDAADPGYADLLAREAELARASLPAGDSQRATLAGWQAEALAVLLERAQTRRDWGEALRLLDALIALPAGEIGEVVEVDALAEQQRSAQIQQALQLLEQGNREGALALAGETILDEALQPPASQQSLFARWAITATLAADEAVIDARITPAPGQATAARSALAGVVDGWLARFGDDERFAFLLSNFGTEGILAEGTQSGDARASAVQMQLVFPLTTAAAALRDDVPNRPEWALLRALLEQAGPSQTQTGGLLSSTLVLEQSFDLRAASDQWRAVAANLARQAQGFETDSQSARERGNADEALRARVRATNYRAAADTWRTLDEQSWLIAQLVAAPNAAPNVAPDALVDGTIAESRAWLIEPGSPPQTLTLYAEPSGGVRVLGGALVALLGLFLLAGVLWWLL